jgi:putative transposase
LKRLARFPREKKAHKWNFLVYSQSGWRVLDVREVRKGKKLLKLYHSHLGIFKVLVHRDFFLEKVKRVVVKLAQLGEVYITFIAEVTFLKLERTNKAVEVDIGVEKLLVTSDGEYLPNPRPYERALAKIKRLHRTLFRNRFKAKVKLARIYKHLKNFRRNLYMKLGK